MSPRINVNHVVSFLALVLAIACFSLFSRMGAPSKIAWGSAILSILVVAIFWSAINLGADEEEDDL
jgi:hypothetical protein